MLRAHRLVSAHDCRWMIRHGIHMERSQIIARALADKHRLIGAQPRCFVAELVSVVHPADHLADAAAEMAADEFQLGEFFEHTTHDHAGDSQTLVKGSANARGQAVVAHALFAKTYRWRVHHHRHSKACDHFKKWPSLVVIGVGTLMARVDEHAFQTAFNDGSLKLFQKRLAAAGQGAGENDDPVAMLVLNLGSVVIPAMEKRQRLLRSLVPEIMDRIADDAEIDADALVSFQQIFNGKWRNSAPKPLFGQFRRINVRVPIDNHLIYSLLSMDFTVIAA